MNDRELLELAAKAAGLTHVDYSTNDYDGRYGLMLTDDVGRHIKNWRPLTDDSDALRLAVSLRLRIEQTDNYSVCYSGTCMAEQFTESHCDSNAFIATRRAIVRAAAEIGRAMP